MKQKKIKKICIIFLEYISILAAALSLLALLFFYGNGMEFSLKMPKQYHQTRGFANTLETTAFDLLVELKKQEKYSTEGENASRILDLKEFSSREGFSYQNKSGLAYSLSDLKDWAASGYVEGDVFNVYRYNNGTGEESSENQIVVCQKADGTYHYYYYDEFARLLEKEQLTVIPVYDIYDNAQELLENLKYDLYNGTIGNMDDYKIRILNLKKEKDSGKAEEIQYVNFWNYGERRVFEKYAPVGHSNLLEVVNENPNWNGKLGQAYNALTGILSELSYMEEGAESLFFYREGNTNLTYLYGDIQQKKLYSNNPEFSDWEKQDIYLKNIRESNAYILFSSTIRDSITNLYQNLNLNLYQDILLNGLTEKGSFLAVSVDTSYPISDSLAASAEYYEKWSGWIYPLLLLAVTSLLLFFLGLIPLSLQAGKKDGEQTITLVAFDRWFTEIAAGILLIAWLCGFACWVDLVDSYAPRMGNPVISCFGYFVTAIFAIYSVTLFLPGWLSLVRRIKAKALWRGSLLYYLLNWLRKSWKKFWILMESIAGNRHYVIKKLLFTIAFLLLQFFLFLLANDGVWPALLLTLAIDLAVLYFLLKEESGKEKILTGLQKIADGDLQYKIEEETLSRDQKRMAGYINRIREGLDAAVAESLKNERMKTELITNVSHDIKTPLTSIISYIDLLKRENIQDTKIQNYVRILDEKSQRLKILTEDIVEASKASTGNITLNKENLNFVELLHQVIGEFEEKYEEKHLSLVVAFPEKPVFLYADGRYLWRILENLFGNALKYSMPGTRVYVSLTEAATFSESEAHTNQSQIRFSMKNISSAPLNISADELTERFIRGDLSRNTEGSGLGLSIAKSLTTLQGGTLQLYLDGDLFKVTLTF